MNNNCPWCQVPHCARYNFEILTRADPKVRIANMDEGEFLLGASQVCALNRIASNLVAIRAILGKQEVPT